MGLPKLDTPTYELNLPVTNQTIKYRPFLVKEEKILLMALETESEDQMLSAVKQIINNCIITEIDVEELPLFEIEYIFLKLRSKSVGEIVTLKYKNNNCTENDGQPCGKELQVMVNLDDIKLTIDDKHSMKVQITKDIDIIMQYPKMNLIHKIDTTNPDEMFNLILECIKVINDKDQSYDPSKFEKEELNEFISSMTQEQFLKIKDFFDTMPALKHTVNVKCKQCGFNEEVTLRGLKDFFA